MDRVGTPPKRVTSPAWRPPTHVNCPLENLKTKEDTKKDSHTSFVEKIWKFKLEIFQSGVLDRRYAKTW